MWSLPTVIQLHFEEGNFTTEFQWWDGVIRHSSVGSIRAVTERGLLCFLRIETASGTQGSLRSTVCSDWVECPLLLPAASGVPSGGRRQWPTD